MLDEQGNFKKQNFADLRYQAFGQIDEDGLEPSAKAQAAPSAGKQTAPNAGKRTANGDNSGRGAAFVRSKNSR